LLDVSEVAERLGRSTRWVRERAKRGDLPFVRLDGSALAFDLEDVRGFARARRISCSALAGSPEAAWNGGFELASLPAVQRVER
jgi:excisionase family DNA binding protein